MRITNTYAKRKARIEIVPLIDIIFFLMATFVMVSLSMIKNEGVPVNLPAASTAMPQERSSGLTVSVTKSGEIYLDKQLVSEDQLKMQLSLWKAQEKDPRIFIHGDEETSFKNMMFVMDTIRGLGITKVAMQTRPGSAKNENL